MSSCLADFFPVTSGGVPGITAPPLPRRVAVFRALQLGDLLCAVPALRALRTALPQAHITLVGLPWARRFTQRFRHYLDDFLEFPGAPGLIERQSTADEYADFLRAAAARRFDLAVQLHGDGRHSNAVVRALGARYTIECAPTQNASNGTHHVLPYPDHLPEVHRLLAPLLHVGIKACGDHLEFPIEAADDAALAAAWPERAARHTYICLHPGARLATRRWPAACFAQLADACVTAGYTVVLTGSEEERGLVQTVAQAMRHACVDLSGRTSLGALAALLRDARLVICNDTGVSHVTAAVGTPSVVVYGGSEPERWAPLDTRRHRRALFGVACRPCYHTECPVGHVCVVKLSPSAVWRHVRDALNDPLPDPVEPPCADYAY